MKIITVVCLLCLPFTVEPRRTQVRSVQNERRRAFAYGGMKPGGLQKQDHIKDWRTTKAPTAPPPIPTRQPTTPPTTSPTTSLTPAPTSSPTRGDSFGFLDFPLSVDISGPELDILNDGYGPGDVFLFEEKTVFVEEVSVGVAHGRCVVLQDFIVFDQNRYCHMELEFEDGSVTIQGVLFELLVVGGTGIYSDIRGVFELLGGPPETLLLFFAPVEECLVPEHLFASPWIEEAGDTYVDWDFNGRSSGDVFVFDNSNFVTGGLVTGVTEGECMVLEDVDGDNKTFCTITFITGQDFADLLTAQGVFDNMVITAGFGCFAGVSGSISGNDLGIGEFQYNLLFDDEDSASYPSCAANIFDEPWTEPFGDVYVDYEGDDFSPGDAFVFDNKPVTVPAPGETGVLAGRIVLIESDILYANMVFTFDVGQIAVQGDYYSGMTIVGGNGCFRDLQGTVEGSDEDEGFVYQWSITS